MNTPIIIEIVVCAVAAFMCAITGYAIFAFISGAGFGAATIMIIVALEIQNRKATNESKHRSY